VGGFVVVEERPICKVEPAEINLIGDLTWTSVSAADLWGSNWTIINFISSAWPNSSSALLSNGFRWLSTARWRKYTCLIKFEYCLHPGLALQI
jgi:hypothetical protein